MWPDLLQTLQVWSIRLSVKTSYGASVIFSILSIYMCLCKVLKTGATSLAFLQTAETLIWNRLWTCPSCRELHKTLLGFSKEGSSFFLEAAGRVQPHGEDAAEHPGYRVGWGTGSTGETLVLEWTVLGRLLGWRQLCILAPLFLWHPCQSCTPCQCMQLYGPGSWESLQGFPQLSHTSVQLLPAQCQLAHLSDQIL